MYLRLNISRGCGRDKHDTDHFIIPSLRLNYIENNEYYEPVRDRDKCWTIDSQREILNNDPDKKFERFKLKLGEHKKLEKFPPLTWCPPLQTSLRKRSLLRQAAVISDTHCFVNIYGLGVAGRINAPGGTSNRMLLIEAYSVWDSTVYSIPLHIPQLKVLLRGREELLTPGRKKELLQALIPLLYFDYEITYTITEEEIDERRRVSLHQTISTSESNNQIDTSLSQEISILSVSEPVSEIDQEINHNNLDQTLNEKENTLYIHHLDKFQLPPGYPQSIADIIRELSSTSDLVEFLLPKKLTQNLKISPIIRENGPVVRRRDIEEKMRLEKLEEDRKRKIWQDTPKRYKGLLSGKCIRKYGKFIVVSSYRLPLKPTVIKVNGHVFNECIKLSHFLDLGSIGKSYGIHLSPRKWDNDLAKMICKRTTKQLTTGESTRSTLYLSYKGKTGSEAQLSFPKSCNGFQFRRSVTKERNLRLPSRWEYVSDIPLHVEHNNYTPSTSCLGKYSSRKRRLYYGDPICGNCKPRREIHRPKRLLTRGKKIGHIYGIYTLYLIGKLSNEPLISINEMEDRIVNKYYSNELLPNCLGPLIELMIEIYFPENPTFVAHKKGQELDFGSHVQNSPTVLRISLHRGDLCRLIDDKYLLRNAFRVSHQEFEEYSSKEDIKIVEDCWYEIGEILISQCRWRRTLEGVSMGRGYYGKLTHATSLMSIESIDVTNEVIGRNPNKVIVEKPIMYNPNSNKIIKKKSALVSKDSEILCDSRAELVLVLPSILHIQNCQISSLSEKRENVSLKVIIWQKGIQFGIICFDWYFRDIYFTQPSQVEQETLCIPLQSAGKEEVIINMSLYVTSFVYQEKETKDGNIERFVTIESGPEENQTIEYSTTHFEEMAISDSKVAFEAARTRQTAAHKTINELEDNDINDDYFDNE